MPLKFKPNYSVSPKILNALVRIEKVKDSIVGLPINPKVLISLRESAKLYTTHYSTMIEGNQLNIGEIQEVLEHKEHFPGRERDEAEVKGYYVALGKVEQWASEGEPITQQMIKTLHALVMAGGRTRVKGTDYREGQNVIRNARTGDIVYLPPEAKDVEALMGSMVEWIEGNKEIPAPIVAGIAHYQFATIHPYYDGNGRTARLLTTLILHLRGYGLKGIYSLEEYYAKDLPAYYKAVGVGPSHNYYLGRAEADITGWVEYFLEGMAYAFENVLLHMQGAEKLKAPDFAEALRDLDPRQRKVLGLFQASKIIKAKEIGEVLGLKERSSRIICHKWVEQGFLLIADSTKKGRSYKLAKKYEAFL